MIGMDGERVSDNSVLPVLLDNNLYTIHSINKGHLCGEKKINVFSEFFHKYKFCIAWI